MVLASGTLSPLDSLKTELGMEFPIVMQGAQVIPREQMFVSAISHVSYWMCLLLMAPSTNITD